jgi:phospholipid/cholesterol/gamma-HCH transport system substrate-binding protein
MSNSKTLRFRLGLFVVVALVLFGALVVMFGSLPTLFKRSSKYTVRFVDAPGLTVGSPVRRSGVHIGEVREITLDEERGIVIAKLAINAPYTIRRNEVPTLVIGILGSDASIDLIPKSPDENEPADRAVVEPGTEFVGVRAATMNTLLKDASGVVPTTQELLNDIRKSMLKLDRLAGRAEKTLPLLEDTLRDYRDLARQAMPELEKTGSEIRDLVRTAKAVVPQIQRTAREYELLGKEARESLPQLQNTLDDVDLLAKDIRAAVPELMKTNAAVRDLARSVNDAVPSIERAVDEVGGLAADARKVVPRASAVIDDVGSTARGAGKLIEEFDLSWQKNRDSVEQSLNNLNRTLQQTANLMSDDNVRKINRTLTNVATASDDFPKISRNAAELTVLGKKTLEELQPILKQLDATLGDFSRITKPFGTKSDRIAGNLDKITSDFAALMTSLDRSNGTLKKILTDPSLYNNVDAAAVSAMKLIPRLEQILKDFEVFSDKLARHPELLGVRGAIGGSSGLKNPPTPPLNTQPRVVPGTGIYPPK